MENLRVMYFHGKTTDGFRFTIAGLIDGAYLKMGISVCSGRDQFTRAKGRAIATERLLSQRNYKLLGRDSLNLYSDVDNPSGISLEKDYFVGYEFDVFTNQAAQYNRLGKHGLLKMFNLENR
jgi:hypothetical protein